MGITSGEIADHSVDGGYGFDLDTREARAPKPRKNELSLKYSSKTDHFLAALLSGTHGGWPLELVPCDPDPKTEE